MNRPNITVVCAAVLIAASMSTAIAAAALPGLAGLRLVEGWDVVVLVHCCSLAIVVAVQGWGLRR